MDSAARSFEFAWILATCICNVAFSQTRKSSEIVSPQRRPMQKHKIHYTCRYRRILFSAFSIDVYSAPQNIGKRRCKCSSKERQYFDSCIAFTAGRRTAIECQWHCLHEMRATATLWIRIPTRVSLDRAVCLDGVAHFQHVFITCANTTRQHAFV